MISIGTASRVEAFQVNNAEKYVRVYVDANRMNACAVYYGKY
jgi:hypothetical protein